MEGPGINSGPAPLRSFESKAPPVPADSTGTLGEHKVSIDRPGTPRLAASGGLMSLVKSLAARFFEWVTGSANRSAFVDAGVTATRQVDAYLSENVADSKNPKSQYFQSQTMANGQKVRIATGFATDCGRSAVKYQDESGSSTVIPHMMEASEAFKKDAVAALLARVKGNTAQLTSLTAVLHQTNMVGVYSKVAFEADPSDKSLDTASGARYLVQTGNPKHQFKIVQDGSGLSVEVGMLMKSNQLLNTRTMEVKTTAKDHELEWRCKIRIHPDGGLERVGIVQMRHTMQKL